MPSMRSISAPWHGDAAARAALSSTACCLRVLKETGQLDSVHGRTSLAILLVQDLAVVPLAILMTLLAGTGSAAEVTLSIAKTVALAIALALNVGARRQPVLSADGFA